MPTPRNVTINDMTRVWALEGGAGPLIAPEYMGVWKAGAPSWDFGEAEAVEIPSDSERQKFNEVATLAGETSKPTMDFTARFSRDLSDMLRMARRECFNDFQVHVGLCQSPTNYLQGWDKIVALEKGLISNYSAEELGALSSDERAAVNEAISVQGVDYFEIKKLAYAAICATSVIQEVISVFFCDTKLCGGECGLDSDGCQKLFGVVLSVGGSPGLGAQIVYSDDAGATCGATPITTLPANQDPDDGMCHGTDVVVVSEDSESHHYADRDLILLGTEVWAEQGNGYVAGNGPRCCWSLKPGYAWVGGANGYIYFLANTADAVTVQNAGVATDEDLNDIHAYDEENVVAVGANNAVVYTTDGSTWTILTTADGATGPNPGTDLYAVWMINENTWWIGDAGGQLWFTQNAGLTWTEKQFPGSGTGVVRDIEFNGTMVGYLAHDTTAPLGRILRTIDGGYQWYVLPEGAGAIPDNDRIDDLATCGDHNVVVGGGLDGGGTDGIMVKAS